MPLRSRRFKYFFRSAAPIRKESTMDKQKLIDRFESEMAKVNRPGVDKLMEYIRKSDFYTAPASTKYHLACESGLLQHSLNVLDALRGLLTPADTQMTTWHYTTAGRAVETISDECVIIMALLHDICKTHFYGISTRNAKNEKTGKWEKVPFYTVDDKMPLGHGAKSAMIIKQYMELTSMETYAIWWHMGFNGNMENDTCVGLAIEKYPIVLALQTADMQAAKIMEAGTENKPPFNETYEPESETNESQPKPKPTAKAKPKQEQPQEESTPDLDFDETDYQDAVPLPSEPPQEVN